MNSTEANAKQSEPDILVIGAGPTGLTAAGELARRGISVRIVEKRPDRSPLSKALVLQARTLEMLDIVGLADEFTRLGYPAPGLNASGGTSNSISIDVRSLDSRFPYLLVLPQKDTEEILERRVTDYGVFVERECELIGLHQTETGQVVSTIRDGKSREYQIRSRYAIGCDGAHSDAREFLKVPFLGKTYDIIVFLADVKLDTELVRSRITNFTSRRGFLSVLPFLGEYSRIFAFDPSKQDRPEHDELTLAELQETVDAIAPIRLKMSAPRWLARFRSPSRQVPNMRIGSIFIAGDAAHAHTPAGGQGMNSGMQDALNLAWKLGMVLRKEAPVELLDTYHAERHPVDARLRRETDLMFKTFMLRNPVLKGLRDVALRGIVSLPPLHKRLARDLSNLDISFRWTERSRMQMSRRIPKSVLRAGDRAPDMELWGSHGSISRLYELLRESGYAVFVYVEATCLAEDRMRVATLIREVRENYRGIVRLYIVLDEGDPGATNVDATAFIDFKLQFRNKFGARHGSLVMVRPDGYLGFHDFGFTGRTFRDWLNTWVSLPDAYSRGKEDHTRAA
jgi:2-polyprenyl-6-methoxyphenol hydroxylase-like FAD-dependent oxidoreductase